MITALRRLFGLEQRSLATLSPAEAAALFQAFPTAAGVSVTPATALRAPVVYAVVKILAESVAQLPLILYRRTADGGKERATDDPRYTLLHDGVNSWTTSFDWRLTMQTALCLYGNAYSYLNRDRDGRITELINLPSEHVVVEVDTATLEPSYRVTAADGTTRTYDRRDILHIKTIGTDPHRGLSPIETIRESIGLAIAMERHAAALFGRGARPSGVFRYGKMLSPEMIVRLRESFNRSHAGPDQGGGTLVLEDGMDFTPLQFSSVDLQFLELRRYQLAEIARAFRIPLHLLQELERTTHANAESLGRQYLTLSLLPWLKCWESALNQALFAPEERRDYLVEFLTDDLVRADIAARFEALFKAVGRPWLTVDEARAIDNRAAIDGGGALFAPLNQAPAAGGAADGD